MAVPRRTILLVEDERLIALNETRQLQNGGYDVVNAYTGEEAVRKVESDRGSIDLVLMDVDLGNGIDGIDAAEKILDLKGLPVMFLSSHAEPSIVEKSERIANFGYVEKSSAFTVLDASIKTACRLFDSSRVLVEREREARRNEIECRKLFENSRDAIARDEYLEGVIEATQDGFIAVDENGFVTDANEAFCRMTGYDKDELLKRRITDLEAVEDEGRVQEVMDYIKKNGSLLFDVVLVRKGGEYIHVELSVVWVEKTIDRFICFCRNIDERVRTAVLLEQKSGLLTAIFESSPEVIVFALDREYRYIAFNRRHKETMRQIWGRDIDLGTNMLHVIMDETDRAAAKANFDRALAGEHFALEEMYGDERLTRAAWLDYYSPILDSRGAAIGLSCFVLNITERKRAERRIEQLLEEKELILREVHHRVKNNMNTICALLNIRAQLHDNEEVRTIINDAKANVQSMMLLYDRLYRSDKFDKISLRDYFTSLLREIVAIFPRQIPLTVESSLDDVELDATVASNLGIITNELITNSMKHAFPRESPGDGISIEVRANGGSLHYVYSDSGIGLPQAFSIETAQGFGLQLVKMLADQLSGSIRREGDAGARFAIEIPV
jgi:PAS domain S-box-containing protein